MAQVKKEDIRDAILNSARYLFTMFGYNRTKISAIASNAGLSVGNIYAYFPSKLDLLYAIYRPWLLQWYKGLEVEVRQAGTPKDKLGRLLIGIWHEFPASNPGLANSLMEALASSDVKPKKPDDLLAWIEERVTELLIEVVGPEQASWWKDNALAHVILMAQDGFIINYRWGDHREMHALADMISDLLLYSSGMGKQGHGRAVLKPSEACPESSLSSRS